MTTTDNLTAELARLNESVAEIKIGYATPNDTTVNMPDLYTEMCHGHELANKLHALLVQAEGALGGCFEYFQEQALGLRAGTHPKELAQQVIRDLTAIRAAVVGQQSRSAPKRKPKCKKCDGTGKYTWTDYSNGQGLDIDRTEDCDACAAGIGGA